MPFRTLHVRNEDDVAYIQFNRPAAGNTINDQVILEMGAALDQFSATAKVIVLEGNDTVFSLGADFQEVGVQSQQIGHSVGPGPLYDIWSRLAEGPFVSVAHVRGRVNAGGVGFVAACDVVLAQDDASFSLSELLFGLMPACVLPFLIRRVGLTKANYLTLMTAPINAARALEIGLVDAVEENSANLLRKHLLRLRRLDANGIRRYKIYIGKLTGGIAQARELALAANLEVFSDEANLRKIRRYTETGQFPWEGEA